MNAEGNTVFPTVLSAISAVLNMILDPIFIFTFNMGIAGAAIATLLSKAILAIAGVYVLMRRSSKVRPSFKKFKFDVEIIKKIISVALPSSIGQSGSALGFMALNVFIVSYGTATLAAFAMVNRITSLVSQPAMGIGAALTSIIGQNLGCSQLERAKEAFVKAIKLTIGFSALGLIILLAFDKEIIGFFMQSKDDMILLFKNFTNIGSVGIWFSMSFSNLIICIFGYIMYRKGAWEKNIIHNEDCREIKEAN